MLQINNIKLALDTDFSNLISITAKVLGVEENKIKSAKLIKKSVDARRKHDVHFICSVIADIAIDENKFVDRKDIQKYEKPVYVWANKAKAGSHRPVVVGFGPAGLFAALTLAKAGLCPIIIERGRDVDRRQIDVDNLWQSGDLNTNSNVQFGEGGAGTFSDGKLNTGTKDLRSRAVLETFAECGANENILYDAKPHVGTDILKNVIKNIRNKIISLGGEVRFENRLTNINIENEKVKGIEVDTPDGKLIIECDELILAIGHSARDTFELMYSLNLPMTQKPFSIGARIEHPQMLINKSQYGSFADYPALGAADYKLSVHLPSGRGVYTFCMCPGGFVVNSSSEEECVVTNGMSYSGRNEKNANSALLVSVGPNDFESEHPLAGMYLQRQIENRAYKISNGYGAPCQRVGDFLKGVASDKLGEVEPTFLPRITLCKMEDFLPDYITNSMRDGILMLDKKLKGFAFPDALLTGPETRSSSPVRILRDDIYQTSVKGIYPAGEGSGYAGGIVSAAVDGIKVAESILNQ